MQDFNSMLNKALQSQVSYKQKKNAEEKKQALALLVVNIQGLTKLLEGAEQGFLNLNQLQGLVTLINMLAASSAADEKSIQAAQALALAAVKKVASGKYSLKKMQEALTQFGSHQQLATQLQHQQALREELKNQSLSAEQREFISAFLLAQKVAIQYAHALSQEKTQILPHLAVLLTDLTQKIQSHPGVVQSQHLEILIPLMSTVRAAGGLKEVRIIRELALNLAEVQQITDEQKTKILLNFVVSPQNLSPKYAKECKEEHAPSIFSPFKRAAYFRSDVAHINHQKELLIAHGSHPKLVGVLNPLIKQENLPLVTHKPVPWRSFHYWGSKLVGGTYHKEVDARRHEFPAIVTEPPTKPAIRGLHYWFSKLARALSTKTFRNENLFYCDTVDLHRRPASTHTVRYLSPQAQPRQVQIVAYDGFPRGESSTTAFSGSSSPVDGSSLDADVCSTSGINSGLSAPLSTVTRGASMTKQEILKAAMAGNDIGMPLVLYCPGAESVSSTESLPKASAVPRPSRTPATVYYGQGAGQSWNIMVSDDVHSGRDTPPLVPEGFCTPTHAKT